MNYHLNNVKALSKHCGADTAMAFKNDKKLEWLIVHKAWIYFICKNKGAPLKRGVKKVCSRVCVCAFEVEYNLKLNTI